MARDRWGIFLLLLLSLAIRVCWALVQPSTDAAIDRLPDQREYLTLGRNVLHEGSLRFIDPRFDQPVYAYRTPGYPVFIAALGGSPIAVRLGQAIVDTSTVLAVFLLARQLSGDICVALIAATLVALNPFLIYFSGLILSETLFTAALAWATVLLVRQRAIAGGLILLIAILIRPSALMLAPILAAVAVFLNPARETAYPLLPAFRRAVTAAVITGAIVFLGLVPWAYRNHRILGSWIWTTTNAGITLYDGFHPAARGDSDQRFLTEMPQLRSMNEVRRSQYLQGEAHRWAADHAAELPGLTWRKIARTWSPVPLSAEFGRTAYRIVSAAYAIPLDLLTIFGLFSRQLRRSAKMLLVAPAVYFTVVHAMSVGSLRYRVPVEPELAVIAAIGAASSFSVGARHRGLSSTDQTHGNPRV